MKEYFTRHIKYPDGTLEELKVPKEEIRKQILASAKRDKEMLDILAKL
ncbi:MAG: hypothetical protein GW780_00655 [Candidatus Aenigmarchaeota archaeon]|nr:hypothetical protein [Candidatus Aenigmarchaeota archaeon]NCS70664.1 hypothetical protein [Candidatus Aenigmarchaeota archaeon]